MRVPVGKMCVFRSWVDGIRGRAVQGGSGSLKSGRIVSRRSSSSRREDLGAVFHSFILKVGGGSGARLLANSPSVRCWLRPSLCCVLVHLRPAIISS